VEILVTRKKRLTISLSDVVYKKLDDIAERKGLTKSAVLTIALDEYLKGQKK